MLPCTVTKPVTVQRGVGGRGLRRVPEELVFGMSAPLLISISVIARTRILELFRANFDVSE